jgi:hypothetical protein
MDSEASNSERYGPAAACCSSRPRLRAEMRVVRERPAPLSMTSSGMARPAAFSVASRATRLVAMVAGGPLRSAPSVR